MYFKYAALGAFALAFLTNLNVNSALAQSINIQLTPSRTSCVAPCSVFFDASDTTAPSTNRPFRDLSYSWNFDDANAGIWSFSGKNKNQAFGAIAGHVFHHPGVHDVLLTVRDSSGFSSSRITTVSVSDPNQTFSGTNTTCVSASNDFDGCPAGARHTESSSVNSSLLNQDGNRTLYRRGEQFALSSGITLTDATNVGSQIGVFPIDGTAKARFNAADGARLTVGSNWSVSDLRLVGSGLDSSGAAFGSFNGSQNFSALNVDIERFNSCAIFDSKGAVSDAFLALVDVTCRDFANPGSGTKLFEATERSMFLGVEIDKGEINNPGLDNSEFNHRMIYARKKIIQHSKYHGRAVGQSKNVLQIRHCNRHFDSSRCQEEATPGQYLIVSDNHFIEEGGPLAATVIRICDEAGCGNQGGNRYTQPDGLPSMANQVEHIIFERNIIQFDFDDPNVEDVSSIFDVQAARVTIRNNIFDLQRLPLALGNFFRILAFDRHPTDSPYDNDTISLDNNEHWMVNNSIYLGSNNNRNILVCDSLGVGTNHACENNLMYAPNSSGSIGFVNGSGWAQSNGNLNATTNPFTQLPSFLAASPANSSTYFQLQTGSNAIDAGVVIPGAQHSDFTSVTARPQGAAWDVGAFEYSTGGGSDTVPPNAPQILRVLEGQ